MIRPLHRPTPANWDAAPSLAEYQAQYRCLYRPVWYDLDNPTTHGQAIAAATAIYQQTGRPCRVVDRYGRPVAEIP
jgi:hypothetical protein